jgi:hypothetical protein
MPLPPRRFHPRDGAVLDLQSLDALAHAAPAAFHAGLVARWPGKGGMVLRGLELSGGWSTSGPPGTVRPDPASEGVVISPGLAIVEDLHGVTHLVEVTEELREPWPFKTGPATRGVLVLMPVATPEVGARGIAVARDRIDVRIGFVPPDKAEQRHVLPLAASLGNGRDWATDLRRLWHPNHRAVRDLRDGLERLLNTVMGDAEPEGTVWQNAVFGRDWSRYQTLAAAAIQSARMELAIHPLTTLERVRLMCALYAQLKDSVERAATELLQLVGAPEEAGPYRAVYDGLPVDEA